MRTADIMWLIVAFDLPTTTDLEKRAHTRFRNQLLRLGFTRLQWSVYARAYVREKTTAADRNSIVGSVPPGGRVRILSVTDMQFEHMMCIDGIIQRQPERAIGQIVIFE
jgi:CRISPR-associated protein Cas2